MRTAPPLASGRAGDENRKVAGNRFSSAVVSPDQVLTEIIIAPLHFGPHRRVVVWGMAL